MKNEFFGEYVVEQGGKVVGHIECALENDFRKICAKISLVVCIYWLLVNRLLFDRPVVPHLLGKLKE